MAGIKAETIMAGLAGIVILYLIFNYSRTKTISGFEPNSSVSSAGGESIGMFASSEGATSAGNTGDTPDSLLPRDRNASWENTPGAGPLTGINLLKPSDTIGINGRGQVLKNANLQIRSDPVIGRTNVGPWNNSTILPDTMRTQFEIGSDCKM